MFTEFFRQQVVNNRLLLKTQTCRAKHPKEYEWVIRQFPEYSSYRDKVCAVATGGYKRCEVCGKIISFYPERMFCSSACYGKSERMKEVTALMTSEEAKQKARETSIRKYGVEHFSQLPETREKSRRNFDHIAPRYGKDNPLAKGNAAREKRKQTMIDRYGSEHALCNKKLLKKSVEKRKKTMETHGEEVEGKRKKTMIDRYGVPYAMQNEILKDKHNNSIFERFGVREVLSSPDIIQQRQETMLERFGTKYPGENARILSKAVATGLGISGEFETPEEAKHAYITGLGIDCTLEEASNIRIGHSYKPISKELILAKLGRIPITTEMVRKEYTHAYPVLHEYNLMKDYSISTPHQIVLNWLDELDIGYQTNTRKVITPKELDIYIPDHRLAIEVNGWYWHDSFKKTPRDYHAKKADNCETVGVQLLQFWDYEIQQKPELIKSIIQAKLGRCKKLPARNLTVEAVPSSMAREFLNTCHLNGYTHAKNHLGLFDDSQLVMILSYGKSRFEKDVTEIIRIACSHEVTVVGGVSKLLKHANIHGPIVSYADRRISDGNVYRQLGFQHVYNTNYGYHYFDGHNCYSRQQFQKHKLIKEFGFPESMTEFEMAETLGLAMLCDAGHMKFIKECKHETS